jgi:hypothetical protein
MSTMYAEFQFDNRGFKMIGRDWADPAHAFTAAHDMIEHFPDDTGIIEDEVRALGAGIWLRSFSLGSMPRIIARDIFYTMEKYNIRALSAPNIDYDTVGVPLYLFDSINAMGDILRDLDAEHDSYRMSEDMIEKAIQWATIGLCQAWARYSDCRDSIVQTFKNLNYLFDQQIDDFWYWNGSEYRYAGAPIQKKGMFYVMLDTTTGQIESEFVPSN